MKFAIKDRLNSTIQETDKQYKRFRDEYKSITELTIYTAEEKNRRMNDLTDKYKKSVKTTCENIKKCVASWIKDDINKLCSKEEKEKNLIYMATDLYTLNVGKYEDEDKFIFLQKYFGDMEAMKRFLGIPALKENRGKTFHMLSKAKDVDESVKDIIEKFDGYLNTCQSRLIDSNNYISSVCYADYLTRAVDELCSTLEFIERLKTAEYEDVKNEV